MNHLKAFEAHSDEYYREVSKEDYLDIRWYRDRRYRNRSERLDNREVAEIESHCAKALSGRKLLVPIQVKTPQEMINPRTHDQEFLTPVRWSVIEHGKLKHYFMYISKCVDNDDEPWWAVHLFAGTPDGSRSGLVPVDPRFFICDGMWGLRRMIADQV